MTYESTASNKTIFSVVDRKRFGLFNLSNDLKKLLVSEDFNFIKKHNGENSEINNSFIFFLELLFEATKGDRVIVWNIGPTFVFSIFLRLKGVQTIYTYHEPLSLKERMLKVDKFIIPIFNHVLISLCIKLFTKVIVLNKKNINKKYGFAPLPIKFHFIGSKTSYKPLTLLFLGGRINSRAFYEFKTLTSSKEFKESHFKHDIFPRKDATLESQKIKILENEKVVIWNFFKIPYNQSAVTTDAIKYGIPIIVSKYEDVANQSHKIDRNPFIVVNETNEINIDLLSKIDMEYDYYSKNMISFGSEFYSEKSQIRLWLKVLN